MPLPCNTILLRAILRKAWFDPDDLEVVKPEALFRRNPQDLDGLSVMRAECTSPEECMASFNRCRGVASLHTGRLLDLGIDVVADPDDRRKALIVNLPFENPDDPEQEKLVGDVAKSARIVRRGS